jgi:uncharacterized metal-binding protein YceD (DUF177 family)
LKSEKPYILKIAGLALGKHKFELELTDAFFSTFENNMVCNGRFDVRIQLTKSETMITADIHASGSAELVCDRTLEPFREEFALNEQVFFKYSETYSELSENYFTIPKESEVINLSQSLYDMVTLAIPLKKLHPRLKNLPEGDFEEADTILVYSSKSAEEDSAETPLDPRWEALKKIRNN